MIFDPSRTNGRCARSGHVTRRASNKTFRADRGGNALLCSDRAAVLAEQPLFPDQVVVIGRRALLVPYTDHGVALAQEVRRRLAEHARQWGMPRAIYLGNHGMIAPATSPGQAYS